MQICVECKIREGIVVTCAVWPSLTFYAALRLTHWSALHFWKARSTLLTEMSSKSPGFIKCWPRCLNLNVTNPSQFQRTCEVSCTSLYLPHQGLSLWICRKYKLLKSILISICHKTWFVQIYRISRPIRRTFFPEKCVLYSTCVLCAKGKYYFQTYINTCKSIIQHLYHEIVKTAMKMILVAVTIFWVSLMNKLCYSC